uniref:Serpentine receptor class gamma n=1 Tax=Caenorhabditis japonica TaxID=281687 RepID=A0A8R1IMP9_CAEJA
MLAMYFIICVFILKKRGIVENKKRTDRDTSLVIQALIITIALEVRERNVSSHFYPTTALQPGFQKDEKTRDQTGQFVGCWEERKESTVVTF